MIQARITPVACAMYSVRRAGQPLRGRVGPSANVDASENAGFGEPRALKMHHPFSADVDQFRAKAATVRCQAGETQLCELMQRTLDAGGVRVMTYIGDAFEESAELALAMADRCKLRGIKVVILADDANEDTLAVFREIAGRTGGALLAFRAGDLDLMGEVLDAVATVAIGGRKLLAAKHTPGARLLLSGIKD